MAWTRSGGGSGNTPGGTFVASVTATNSVSCAVGDLICVAVTWDTVGGSNPSVVVDDPAGKVTTFTAGPTVTDTTLAQAVALFWGLVTSAGVPTPRVRFNPTPGTTTCDAVTINCDSFTGSDASSTNDSAGAAQNQIAPGTGTDAVTSGSFTTATSGDLIYAATMDSTSGAAPGSVGTGFTLAQSAGSIVLVSEYRTQSAAGSIAGTFTTANGSDRFVTAAMAIKPAAGGGATPSLVGDYSTNVKARMAQALAERYL